MCAHTAHKAGAVRGCAQSKGSTLRERIVHTAHKEGAEKSGIGLLTVGVQTRRSSLSKPGPDFSNLHWNLSSSLQDLKWKLVVYFFILIRKLCCLFIIIIKLSNFCLILLFFFWNPTWAQPWIFYQMKVSACQTLPLSSQLPAATYLRTLQNIFRILMHLFGYWCICGMSEYFLWFSVVHKHKVFAMVFSFSAVSNLFRESSLLWRDHKTVHFKCISGEDVKAAFGGDASGEGGD